MSKRGKILKGIKGLIIKLQALTLEAQKLPIKDQEWLNKRMEKQKIEFDKNITQDDETIGDDLPF